LTKVTCGRLKRTTGEVIEEISARNETACFRVESRARKSSSVCFPCLIPERKKLGEEKTERWGPPEGKKPPSGSVDFFRSRRFVEILENRGGN